MIINTEEHTITFTANELDRISELIVNLYMAGWTRGHLTGGLGSDEQGALRDAIKDSMVAAKSLQFFGIKARHPHLTEYEGFKPDGY